VRVLHLIKATGLAGAERHLLDLLPGLRARGCDARAIVLDERAHPAREFLEALRAREVPAERCPIHADFDPALVVRLYGRFRRAQPDIVHTHLIHADLHGTWAARWANVPAVVTTRHNPDAFRRRALMRAMNRAIWSRVDMGIAVSESLVAYSRETEGARVPMRVIRHGIGRVERKDPARVRAQLGLPQDAIVVGMVCRLTRQKGVEYGLRAFCEAAARWAGQLAGHLAHESPSGGRPPDFAGAVLAIAGDGPERRRLEGIAAECGGRERIRFLGWRADADGVLDALDILMAPSLWEGFGLVVLEAMARGIPVLASRVGSLPELVVDGETGLLVPPADVDALAGALARLLSDASLRAQLGNAAGVRARDAFSLPRMIEETLEAYREALDAEET